MIDNGLMKYIAVFLLLSIVCGMVNDINLPSDRVEDYNIFVGANAASEEATGFVQRIVLELPHLNYLDSDGKPVILQSTTELFNYVEPAHDAKPGQPRRPPVTALKKVDLPAEGLPTRPTT